MATIMKQKFKGKADPVALKMIRRIAEEGPDKTLQLLLGNLEKFQSEINGASATGNWKHEALETMVSRGLEKVEADYRQRLQVERETAKETIAAARKTWGELQEMRASDARGATLALLDYQRLQARISAMNTDDLKAAVEDYALVPRAELDELDLIGSELIKRNLGPEHKLLKMAMERHDAEHPWMMDENAKKAAAKLRFLDGIKPGFVRLKVGDHDDATMSFEFSELIGVNFDMTVRQTEEYQTA